ncbi:hypothetical protein AWL63_15945 [Sphingomonas panacis]|uniref:Uncharacterized protein n=1 Tax=Sphingomonas panacis TaxID=1560345 RepID=A0A1B3Z6Y4_9SPHN|nr:hypothetical protein [Sphingomonas panacis]AOH83192.1 hypothetical protein AWL63_03570 [Sphingomonas panacis]AOH85132.1 hypothetical protein AWL63_15365 [Sphingomonas panacis]AOH85227.1 hypothetical protein AWL63_15945 [Sphingomonas panacis]
MVDASDVAFVAPWRPLEHDVEREGLPRQLAKELSPDHPLWSAGCEVIGRADSNDDILTVCKDGRFAIVHLTWGQGPGNAEYPHTVIYNSANELNDALWRDAVWQGFVDDFDPNDPRLQVSA